MSDLSKRLRASMRCDAINGDSFERSVCARQMREAADTLDKLAADIAERDTQLFERDAEIRSLAHSLEVAQTALRAADSVIAERDAQISELTAERDEARTAYQVRNTEWHQHELIALALAERHKLRAERAEAELARLRGQEPAAWQFEWIHSGNKWRTHFNAEKPCDLDCYRNVQPLYAEPMPSKESK